MRYNSQYIANLLKHSLSISLVTSLVLLTACSKELDTTSKTSLSSATIYDTESRIEGLANGRQALFLEAYMRVYVALKGVCWGFSGHSQLEKLRLIHSKP